MHIKRSVSNIENIENIVVIIVFFVASHREYREYRGFNSVFITSHREYREYHCFLQCYQFRMFYVTREYSMLTLLSRLTLAHTCIFFFGSMFFMDDLSKSVNCCVLLEMETLLRYPGWQPAASAPRCVSCWPRDAHRPKATRAVHPSPMLHLEGSVDEHYWA